MKFSMECAVDSNLFLENDKEFIKDGKCYIFSVNNEGLLISIKIVVPVKNPEEFYSNIMPNPTKDVKLHIERKVDTSLYNSIVNEFHEFESLLSFYYNLKSIKWISPRYDLIPETKEEQQKINLYGYQCTRKFADPITKISEQSLINSIELKSRYSSLVIHMSFFREGKNEMQNLKFITAFFNFYFVIEGLYNNGKKGARHFENELIGSMEFNEFVDWIIQESKNNKPTYYQKIEKMLFQSNKIFNSKNVIWLLVKVRGDLHHFVNNSKKQRQGTPFNHNEYEAIAFISHGLALKVILQKMVAIDAPLVT